MFAVAAGPKAPEELANPFFCKETQVWPAALAVLGSVVMHVVQTLCTCQLFALLHVQAEAKRLVTEALRSTDPAIAMLKFQWGPGQAVGLCKGFHCPGSTAHVGTSGSPMLRCAV